MCLIIKQNQYFTSMASLFHPGNVSWFVVLTSASLRGWKPAWLDLCCLRPVVGTLGPCAAELPRSSGGELGDGELAALKQKTCYEILIPLYKHQELTSDLVVETLWGVRGKFNWHHGEPSSDLVGKLLKISHQIPSQDKIKMQKETFTYPQGCSYPCVVCWHKIQPHGRF